MSLHRARLRVRLGWAVLVLEIVGVAGVVGCRPSARTAASRHTDTTSSAGLKRYRLIGRVLSVDATGHRAVINHQAIPGLMRAMTMAYPVKDAEALRQLGPGQHITADVVVTADSLWLERIVVLAKKP
jgi:Cu/Ag efflux protein CusF